MTRRAARLAALALLALGALNLPALAQRLAEPAPDALYNSARISDFDYGLVCPAGPAKTLPAPGTHLGVITQRAAWQKVEYTTQVVPLIKGIGFGVDAQPRDGMDMTGVEVTVIHPPYAGTDVTDERWTTDIVSQASNLNFFLFEYPFEMIPGDWAFQATYRGELIYSVAFKVVDPALFPDIAGICKDPALVS